MSALRSFGAVGLLLLGCGAETDGAASLCVEDLTCPDEIEFAESEPGCLPCARCSAHLGECESGGLACARERVDLDAEVTWSSGVVTLTGPLPAEDDGTGVAIEGRAVAGFELSQGDVRKPVLAAGSLEGKLVLGEPSTLLLELRGFDFGGYRVERVFLSAELEPL